MEEQTILVSLSFARAKGDDRQSEEGGVQTRSTLTKHSMNDAKNKGSRRDCSPPVTCFDLIGAQMWLVGLNLHLVALLFNPAKGAELN